MTFRQKFEKIVKKNNSLLCIGLDPDLKNLSLHILKEKEPIFQFNKTIIDATNDLVCAYKPNIAFYEAYGLDGLSQLKKTIKYIHDRYTGIPVILDAKRADIANTAKMYAKSAFEYWGADAVTVYPNLGKDTLLPFLEYKDKLTIILLKTSNPDSGMFQNVDVDGQPYYLYMAKIIKKWKFENLGVFVGATYPKEMRKIRNIFPDNIFLSAGLGAQSAEIEKAVRAGINKTKKGIMFNVSRSILYVSKDIGFAKKTRKEAKKLREEINKYRYE